MGLLCVGLAFSSCWIHDCISCAFDKSVITAQDMQISGLCWTAGTIIDAFGVLCYCCASLHHSSLHMSLRSVCSTGVQWAGSMPLVAFIALLALPGVLTKQFVNCVQLKNAMASLVLHDQQHGQPRKIQ